MHWVVTGAGGMLGRAVTAAAETAGHVVVAATRADLDVTDARSVRSAVVPGVDVVVHCAAWTAVDAAEAHEAQAHAVNAVGAGLVAGAAAAAGARLLHLSTDYVFDGDASTPYAEDAPTGPRSAYGRTKLAGERLVREAHPGALVVRTAWLYGDGPCFPRTVDRLVRERGSVAVVTDQLGQPTWAEDLARVLVDLVRHDAPPGTYHATSAGRASWFDLAVEVAGADRVTPTDSAAFLRPAPRPAWSVLGHDALRRAGVEPIGDWRERWRVARDAVLPG